MTPTQAQHMTVPTQAQIARVAAAIHDEKERGLLAQAIAAIGAAASPCMQCAEYKELLRVTWSDARHQQEIRETIERCAQVADSFGFDIAMTTVATAAVRIAARIRALKDKP